MPSQSFCEVTAAVGGTVDEAAGVVRGVKILGTTSRNGRSYPPATLRAAVGKYEGMRVNIDHGRTGSEPRSYASRIGRLANARIGEGGLFGDLHVNPKHPLGPQLLWDAAHSPGACGLSHNVEGRVVRKGDTDVVESIERVLSVDVVADPATTTGLYEAAAKAEPRTPASYGAGLKAAFRQAVGAAFDAGGSMKEISARIRKLLAAYDKLSADAGDADEPGSGRLRHGTSQQPVRHHRRDELLRLPRRP